MAPVSWMKPSSPKRARSALTVASSTRCWRSSARVNSTICASSGVSLAIVLLLCPQPARGEVGPLAQRAELRPRHALLDQLRARECAEATVDAGDDAAAIADRLDDGHDAVRHDLRMLDDVGRGVDDAGHEQHPIRQRMPAKCLHLLP